MIHGTKLNYLRLLKKCKVDLCSVELVKLHLELTKMFKAKQEKPLCLSYDAFNLLILLPDFIVKECMYP